MQKIISSVNFKLFEIKWGFGWGWNGFFTVLNAWQEYLDGEFNQDYAGSTFRDGHDYFWFIFAGVG